MCTYEAYCNTTFPHIKMHTLYIAISYMQTTFENNASTWKHLLEKSTNVVRDHGARKLGTHGYVNWPPWYKWNAVEAAINSYQSPLTTFIDGKHINRKELYAGVAYLWTSVEKCFTLTLSHLQQICSRRLRKYYSKDIKLMFTFSYIVQNIVAKREIALYEQFLLLTQCFQKSFSSDP